MPGEMDYHHAGIVWENLALYHGLILKLKILVVGKKNIGYGSGFM